MTILVAYVPRPEGQAALDKGIEIAKSRNEHLVVVNASAGGAKEDPSLADVQDFERVQQMLANTDLNAEVNQYVRGKNAVEEINASRVVAGISSHHWPEKAFPSGQAHHGQHCPRASSFCFLSCVGSQVCWMTILSIDCSGMAGISKPLRNIAL